MAPIITPQELGMTQSNAFNRSLTRRLMRNLGLDRLNELFDDIRPEQNVADNLLRKLNISVSCSEDSAQIPAQDGCLLVANLPHGLLDILVAISLVRRQRPDAQVKFLSNSPLNIIPYILDYSLGDGSEPAITVVRRAVDFLKQGGVLITFPASQVAGYASDSFPDVIDHAWRASYLKLAKLASVPIVPLFIYGRNSRKFLLAQLVSERVSRLRLVRELLNKESSEVIVTVGQSIDYKSVGYDAQRVADFVKTTLYLLREHAQGASVSQSPIVLTVSDSLSQEEAVQDNINISEQGVLLGAFDGYQLYCVDDTPRRKICLFLGDRMLFSAAVHVSSGASSSNERDKVHAKFASQRHFDFSHSKVAHIMDNCIEVSSVRYCESGVNLDFSDDILRRSVCLAAKYFGVKHVVSSASMLSDYQGNAYNLFIRYLSAHRMGGVFSRYIVPRGLTFRSHRPSGYLARHMAGIGSLGMLACLISQTESVDIKIDRLVEVMFDSGAVVASFGVIKGEHRGVVSNILLILEC